MLALPPLVHLGQRSYGFYLWHLPFAYWVMRMDGPQQLFWGLLMALALTEFSYKYIEQPPLAWGRKLEEQAKQPRSRKATSIEVAGVVPA